MIREILPYTGAVLTGGERVLSQYRMWHCYDCGLDFSMKTLEPAAICPRCGKSWDSVKND